jgi:Tol biopolymer transport system component
VYHRNTKSGVTDIWISSVSGGSPVRLYADKNASQLAPSWSPDGNWFAYIHAEGDHMSLRKARIGSSDAPVLLKDNVTYFQPQWSPDGNWLIYTDREGVSLISADGKTTDEISDSPWLTGGWSQDGKTLYSIRQNETRRLLVMATSVETGEEKLISDAGVSPILVTDAVFAGFSLSPDGKSFATSMLKSASDLWILEDFDSAPPSLFSFFTR